MGVFSFFLTFMFTSILWAQTPENVVQWRSWIQEARSPAIGLAQKEQVAQTILSNLRNDLALDFNVKDPKTLYETVMADPEKFYAQVKGKGKYTDLFTDFSALINQINVEKQLSDCDDYLKMKEGLFSGSSSYNPCGEGGFSHSYFLWESKTKGEVTSKQYGVPSFMYSENLQEILLVSNSYHGRYGSESNPPLLSNVETLKKTNPGLKAEDHLELYNMMKLQDDAYQRAILNAARNALSTEYQYNSKGWSDKEANQKIGDTLHSICQHCSAETKTSLEKRLRYVIKSDINSAKLVAKDPVEVGKQLCQRLAQEGYPLSAGLSDKEMTPVSLVAGMGRVKTNIAAEKRVSVLSKIAQSGGDGLLVLTETMTDLDEKRPAHIKMNCRDSNQQMNGEIVQKAAKEATEKALEYAKKINEEFSLRSDAGNIRDNLKLLFKSNPRIVGEALNQNSRMGKMACHLIGEIRNNDASEKFNDTVIIWGATVVGGALSLTGILAPAGASITMGAIALGAGSTAVGVGSGLYQYANAEDSREQADLYESATFASGDASRLQITHEEFQEYRSQKLSAMLTLGLNSSDVFKLVNALIKNGKSLTEASRLVASGRGVASIADDVVAADLKVAASQATKVSASGDDLVAANKYLDEISKNSKWKDFAEKVKNAREKMAKKLSVKKTNAVIQATENGESIKFPAYGYSRTKTNGDLSTSKSLDETFEKFYPGQEYEVWEDGMKMVVSPKNKVSGQAYVEIRYDISGNYFRLQKGVFNGKKMKFENYDNMYTDWDGNLIDFSKIDPTTKEFKELMNNTHWNAIP